MQNENTDNNINQSISKDSLNTFEESTDLIVNSKISAYRVRFNYSTRVVSLYKNGSLITSFSTKTGVVGYGYVTRGNKVIAAQVVLNQASGAYAWNDQIAVDGYWGPKSEALTKKVQGKLGLTKDGLIGPKTWSAIFTIAGLG